MAVATADAEMAETADGVGRQGWWFIDFTTAFDWVGDRVGAAIFSVSPRAGFWVQGAFRVLKSGVSHRTYVSIDLYVRTIHHEFGV